MKHLGEGLGMALLVAIFLCYSILTDDGSSSGFFGWGASPPTKVSVIDAWRASLLREGCR